MSRFDLYIIEARNSDGSLLLGKYPQPESFFGMGAIHGMTLDDIAKRIFSKIPNAVLSGTDVPNWARLIDPNWTLRKKTW